MSRVVQLDKSGSVTPTELTAIEVTTISAAKVAKGHNAVIIHFNIIGTGAFTIKIQGAPSHNGNFADMYDNNDNLMSTGSMATDKCRLFVGISEHFKIVATEDTDGASATISYELITI